MKMGQESKMGRLSGAYIANFKEILSLPTEQLLVHTTTHGLISISKQLLADREIIEAELKATQEEANKQRSAWERTDRLLTEAIKDMEMMRTERDEWASTCQSRTDQLQIRTDQLVSINNELEAAKKTISSYEADEYNRQISFGLPGDELN